MKTMDDVRDELKEALSARFEDGIKFAIECLEDHGFGYAAKFLIERSAHVRSSSSKSQM